MLHIDMYDETETLSAKQLEQVEDLLEFTANAEKVSPDAELSVTFVTNERIQEINKEYRQKDKPTDVISFALQEMGEGEIEIHYEEDAPSILGDIIISVPMAKEQAEDYGHSIERELGFLAVHGFLHLLGYDHETDEQEKEMFDKQKEILNAYGLKRS